MPKDKDQADESDPELSLRDKLLSRLSPEALDITKREISVMTRLSTDIVEVLDSLVKLGLFKSRSEVVAAVIEKTILSQQELFEDIKLGIILDATADSPNLATGDFSGLIMNGNIIRNGEIQESLNETMVGINLLDLFNRIEKVSKANRNADKILVEKIIRALLLLEGLVKQGLYFVFKGGTALMLHLNSTKDYQLI